jgi:hypothetical protein
MNISKSEILRKLPAFNNVGKVLIKDQDTKDIIKAIVNAHDQYKCDYDKICSLFYTGNEISTAKNIFNYIKKNVRYIIESDDLQQIKSPSAIFATTSSDCKNYALAINGILDACRRKYGMDCNLYFRFAAYDGSRTPQHVFAVMVTKDGEIWIDPVLDYFNEDKQPNYYKDKKIHNMALMALSGVDPYANIQTAQTRSGLAGFNFSNISSLVTGASSGGGNILNTATSVLKTLPGGDAVAQILPLLNSFFGAKRGAAGTEYGVKKYSEMYPDVVAAGYEPWAHYQENGWREGRYWFENPSVTKDVVDDYLNRYPDVRRSWDNSVLQHYLEYGKNEGRTIKLNLTSAQAEAINKATGSGGGSFGPGGFGPTGSGGGSMGPGGFEPSGSTGTKTAGISPLIILALVGAGAAMFLSKKK